MSVARGGNAMYEREIMKPAIIIGTISHDTRTVLSGLISEILLKYHIEIGAVTRNTIHDSKNTSTKGFSFFSKRVEIFPHIIMPIVAKTESWKETDVIHSDLRIATKNTVRMRFHTI
jgi:hypothetical protein